MDRNETARRQLVQEAATHSPRHTTPGSPNTIPSGAPCPAKKHLKTPRTAIAAGMSACSINGKKSPRHPAVLDHVAAHVKDGMTTAEIGRLVSEVERPRRRPRPLGYVRSQALPPSMRSLRHMSSRRRCGARDSDIVNVDVLLIYSFPTHGRMPSARSARKSASSCSGRGRECVGWIQETSRGIPGDMGRPCTTSILQHSYNARGREVGGDWASGSMRPFVLLASSPSAESTDMLLVEHDLCAKHHRADDRFACD